MSPPVIQVEILTSTNSEVNIHNETVKLTKMMQIIPNEWDNTFISHSGPYASLIIA